MNFYFNVRTTRV